jgi:hypothetical protein
MNEFEKSLDTLRQTYTRLCRENNTLSLRLEMLYEWMRQADWYHFVADHPGAEDWFDEDGAPRL